MFLPYGRLCCGMVCWPNMVVESIPETQLLQEIEYLRDQSPPAQWGDVMLTDGPLLRKQFQHVGQAATAATAKATRLHSSGS